MSDGPSLLKHLKERKLVQWGLAYLAGAWLVLQVLGELNDAYDWPRVIMRSVPVLLAFGLLATLVLAWYHGEKGQQRVSGPELLMLSALLERLKKRKLVQPVPVHRRAHAAKRRATRIVVNLAA